MALSGHSATAVERPLFAAKRTLTNRLSISIYQLLIELVWQHRQRMKFDAFFV